MESNDNEVMTWPLCFIMPFPLWSLWKVTTPTAHFCWAVLMKVWGGTSTKTAQGGSNVIQNQIGKWRTQRTPSADFIMNSWIEMDYRKSLVCFDWKESGCGRVANMKSRQRNPFFHSQHRFIYCTSYRLKCNVCRKIMKRNQREKSF